MSSCNSICSLPITDPAAIALIVSDELGQLKDCQGQPITVGCTTGQIPMGLGPLGNGQLIFKRKFRWTAEITYCCGSGNYQVPAAFVKMGARPHMTIDEVEINFLNGVTWIPGKGKWQTINLTFYDVTGPNSAAQTDTTNGLLGWLASVYDFTDPICLKMGSSICNYGGEMRLTLYDGCGNPVEAWLLQQVWPTDIDWGELDMGSSDECNITLTIRYTNVCYKNFCGGSLTKCPCTGCPTS